MPARTPKLSLTLTQLRCTVSVIIIELPAAIAANSSFSHKEVTMSADPKYTRVALYLQDKHPIRDGMEYARYAEQKGFEAVWQAESRLVRDAIVPMAAYAAVTERIQIGSGVINNWTRNIGLLAATFLTLDDLAPNRIICGIGAWWDPLAKNVGIERRKPLTAMRETIEVMRKLLAMERVTYHGEFHHVDGIELDVVHGRREPRDVKIMIGATGPQMMELTGEIADGAVLNYCVPPDYNVEAMEQLERGAARAGRTLAAIDRPQLIVCSVHEDRQTALDGARELLTQYLAQQPHIAKASGVEPAVVQQIQATLGWPATREQVRAAMKYVPDDLVQHITASGTPAEVKAKVREYIKYGATCPILYPLGDVKLMIDTFADGY